LDFVRLAIIISLKTSLFWQHFAKAALATPPAPIINNFPFIFSP
jgi:hypothetical protein